MPPKLLSPILQYIFAATIFNTTFPLFKFDAQFLLTCTLMVGSWIGGYAQMPAWTEAILKYTFAFIPTAVYKAVFASKPGR